MIDRLLVQSKAAHEAQQKRRPKVKTKKKTTHPSTVLPQKQISLADEDELLGLPVFRAPILPQNSAAHDEIPPPPVQPGTTSASTSGRPRNSDSSKNAWQSFKKFSHDFQIERLRPGSFALSPDSPLVLGQIVELIDFLQDNKVTSVRTVFPFGTPLHEDLDAEAIESLLPSLSDRIIDAASKWVNASPEEQSLHPRPAREACEVLRYLGLRTNLDTPTETLHLIQARIDHLDRRFRSIAENGTQQAALNYFLLPLHWAGLELALRLRVAAHHQKLDSSLFASPTARVQRVIKGLVQYGINSTGKALKTAQPDLSVEIWASLINLSLAAPPAPSLEVEWPTSESLWDHLISELDDRALVNSTHPVMASEALCYAAMTLCSASQISAAGNVLDQPSLFAYWPVIARSLEPITVDDMRESMDKWSSVELTRRDGYLWSLFARIMTMINRWGWVLTDSDGILSKLYDILNARQLDNLAIDAGAKDFPTFLQHFDGSVGTTLEGKDDSAFHILLKLLVHVSRNILSSADTEPDGRRALNRMLMRVTPMRKLPKDSSRAMLVNHYSLFITLAVIAPWTSNQRFSQIKTVISFDQSDKEIRPVIIRAMLYFSLVSYHQNLPLDPVLGWFGQTAQTLRQEYTDFDRKRIQLNAPARKPTKGMSIVTNHAERSRDQKLLTNQLYHCALTLTMVLRAIQNIMDVTTQGIGDQVLFPDARFLNSGECLLACVADTNDVWVSLAISDFCFTRRS